MGWEPEITETFCDCPCEVWKSLARWWKSEGEVKLRGVPSDGMYFETIAQLVWFASRGISLHPDDVRVIT